MLDLIVRLKKQYSNWRNLARIQRTAIFKSLKKSNEIPGKPIEFEDFDDLMRIDPTKLDTIDVDFDAIPFGYDNSPTGIYRKEHGKRFYIGAHEWPFESKTQWAFLTTETLMTEIVARVYARKLGKKNPLIRIELDDVPAIYPIQVPLCVDPRAAADRRTGARISALAKEIVDANSNAVVISNGVDGVNRAMTFQSAKGRNDLSDNDLYVIVTNLAPEQYARLNVIGQWLKMPNIIELFYQDQVNQAVGRNRGFRQSEKRVTKTAVITSNRLYKRLISKLGGSRTQLYEIAQKPW